MSNNESTNGHSHPSPVPGVVQTPGLIGRSGAAGYGNATLSAYMASPEVAEGGSAGGLSRYVHALRRRWLVSLVIAIPLAAGAAYGAWILQPQMYTSNAVLEIKPIENRMIFTTADQDKAGGNASSFDAFRRGQRVMLKQRYLIERALAPSDDRKLLEIPILRDEVDPVAWLEKHLLVMFPDESNIMSVSLSADDPTGLHDIVNAIVSEYWEAVVVSERHRKLDRLNILSSAVSKAETDLRRKNTEWKRLVDANLGSAEKSSNTTIQNSLLQEYATFMQHFTTVRFNLMQEETALDHLEKLQLKRDEEIEITDSELALALQSDTAAQNIENQRRKITLDIEKFKGAVNTGTSRAAQEARDATKKLEALAIQMEERKKHVKGELAGRLRLQASSEIDELRKKTALLRKQHDNLEQHAKKLEIDAKNLGKSSIDAEMLQTEIETLKKVAQTMRDEQVKTDVELQTTTKPTDANDDSWARVRRLSKAVPARAVESKTRLTTTIGLGCISFFFPFFLFVMLDASKHRCRGDAGGGAFGDWSRSDSSAAGPAAAQRAV
jgi:polysaccharide biosynthesis transport protein